MTDERKDKEMDLFNKWKATGKKTYFQELYRSFKPMLFKASQKASYGSSIPSSVFELEAAQLFHDSLQRFNPAKGAQLQSYVYNTVKNKTKRVLSDYQDIGRIPERSGGNMGFYHVGRYQNAKELMEQQLGREPSASEIATKMNVSVNQIERLAQDIRPDISLNSMVADSFVKQDFADDEDVLAMHYHDMNSEQQVLFDHVTGKHGKQAILKTSGLPDYGKIARSMNITPIRLNQLRDQISKLLKDAQGGL